MKLELTKSQYESLSYLLIDNIQSLIGEVEKETTKSELYQTLINYRKDLIQIKDLIFI